MPIISRTETSTETQRDEVLFRCTANTAQELPAEVVSGLITGIFDWLALGIAAASDRVEFRVEGGPADRSGQIDADGNPARLVGRVKANRGTWTAMPPYATLSVVRSELMHVRYLSYQNPIEAEIAASVGAKAASAAVSFLSFLNLAGPMRRKASAEADREQIRQAVDDATVECMVDERYVLLERAELENRMKEAEIQRLKVETSKLAFELSQQVLQSQRDNVQHGLGEQIWSDEVARAVTDNVRLVASVQLMRRFGIEVRILGRR